MCVMVAVPLDILVPKLGKFVTFLTQLKTTANNSSYIDLHSHTTITKLSFSDADIIYAPKF